MSVKYRDYYETLGIKRTSTKDEIRKAYRKLARKYHPDFNQGDKNAEERFKEIQEANAVLSDPEKRKRYDQLGGNWSAGTDFTPPPGWAGSTRVDVGDFGDVFGGSSSPFSDFFQSIFGGFADRRGGREAYGRHRGGDIEAELELSLEDVHRGTRPTITLQVRRTCPHCGGRGTVKRAGCLECGARGEILQPRRMTVNIAPGARQDSVIRLAGKGESREPNAPPGDLYLRIRIRPHPSFEIVGTDDIQVEVAISPWEAALGAKVPVPTLSGSVEVTVPPGTQAGTRLRLREQGLKRRNGGAGDLYVKLKLVLPKTLSREEEELFKQLAKISRFDPRSR